MCEYQKLAVLKPKQKLLAARDQGRLDAQAMER
jgi:hypothetical protein